MRHAVAPTFSRTGRRPKNEDAVWVGSTADSSGRNVSVLAVADGAGGHEHGAEASEIAVHGVRETAEDWLSAPGSLEQKQVRTDCRQLFERVDQAIEAYAEEHLNASKIGTTLVLAVVIERQVCVAHIGDSRAYWVGQDHTVDQVTADHSATAEAVRSGRMTEEEAAESQLQNVLTRSLGGPGTPSPDFTTHSIEAPGVLCVCSDGLSDVLDDTQFAEKLLQNRPLTVAAESLVETAVEQGGSDNVSLVALECGTIERGGHSAAADLVPASSVEDEESTPQSTSPSQSSRFSLSPPGPASNGALLVSRWHMAILGLLVLATVALGSYATSTYNRILPAEARSLVSGLYGQSGALVQSYQFSGQKRQPAPLRPGGSSKTMGQQAPESGSPPASSPTDIGAAPALRTGRRKREGPESQNLVEGSVEQNAALPSSPPPDACRYYHIRFGAAPQLDEAFRKYANELDEVEMLDVRIESKNEKYIIKSSLKSRIKRVLERIKEEIERKSEAISGISEWKKEGYPYIECNSER